MYIEAYSHQDQKNIQDPTPEVFLSQSHCVSQEAYVDPDATVDWKMPPKITQVGSIVCLLYARANSSWFSSLKQDVGYAPSYNYNGLYLHSATGCIECALVTSGITN